MTRWTTRRHKINLLKREEEMTIDKLRAMYADMDEEEEEDNE